MINLGQAQVFGGKSKPLLEEVISNLSYVLQNWLLGIRKTLFECKSKIQIPDIWLPLLQQTNDQLLMDVYGGTHPGNAAL
eukprot:11808135-Ditylum_brightwellii.AAC.1